MDALYWPGYSNPNLKPETAFATDFGYTVRRGPVSFDAALFTRFVLDQILNTATEPLNLGKSLLPGAEMTGRLALGKHLSLSLDYSFIYSLLLNDGSTSYTAAADRRVPYVPVHSAGAEIAYSRGGARVAFDGRYVSTRYTDGANTQATALAPHILFNLSYLQDVGSGLSISLTVKNLLNAVYQTQLGYPMPPLSLWTGLRLAL
jgi:vitamin B12 transporter